MPLIERSVSLSKFIVQFSGLGKIFIDPCCTSRWPRQVTMVKGEGPPEESPLTPTQARRLLEAVAEMDHEIIHLAAKIALM